MGRHRRQTVDMLGSHCRQTVDVKVNVFHRLAAVATEFQRSRRSFVMFKQNRKSIASKFPETSGGFQSFNAPPRGSGGYQNFNVRKCWLVVFMVTLGIIQGCATVPTNIAAPMPSANVAGNSSLASGRKTYVSLLKCAMCHRPKQVSDYSAETWAEDILPRMSKKARLSPQEYANVLTYVTTTTTKK